MKTTDLFNYQKDAMRLLTNSYEKNHLVHAYLLDGANGSGTVDACIYMAKKLICQSENAPCMNCADCKRIDARTHLNFIYIEPESDTIKREKIDALIHDFSMTGLVEGAKVYVIKDAEKMNASASNALLKFLEEPNPNRYAFLTTTNYKKLLDTIVSRCQLIHFLPVPRKYLIEKLLDCGVEKDIAYIVSSITSEFDVAMKVIEEGKITNYQNVAKKIVEKDIKKKDPFVEYYRNRILFQEEQNKNNHRLFLDILIMIYQELLNKLLGKESIYFTDLVNLENDFTKAQIIKKLELLNVYQERFNYYVNLDLQYTSLFSKL